MAKTKRKTVEIKIPAEILREIEAIPDTKYGTRCRIWQPWEDAVLLKYWNSKPKAQLARMLGVSEGTAKARYGKLREEKS